MYIQRFILGCVPKNCIKRAWWKYLNIPNIVFNADTIPVHLILFVFTNNFSPKSTFVSEFTSERATYRTLSWWLVVVFMDLFVFALSYWSSFSCSLRYTITDVFSTVHSTFGRLDVIVNNAGIVQEVDAEKCIAVNLVRRKVIKRVHSRANKVQRLTK
jgi:hypothetical protein